MEKGGKRSVTTSVPTLQAGQRWRGVDEAEIGDAGAAGESAATRSAARQVASRDARTEFARKP